ncbi:hypothetical protein KSP39_PZI011761 [Platanthera zijinensis]|uniref:Tf2-1-like SH3-like domain-containing protein n=1 Tax=Platanthera zijinensis TaxID=2320716 RepID=A0AAP0BGB8_9ASPA
MRIVRVRCNVRDVNPRRKPEHRQLISRGGRSKPFCSSSSGRGRRAHKGDGTPLQHLGMNVEISDFDEKSHPDEFIDWLLTVERVFDIKDLTGVLGVVLAHAEFAFNWTSNRTTGRSPFDVAYGRNLATPLNLLPIPFTNHPHPDAKASAHEIKELQRKEGDLVWIHLRKERFPRGHAGKLQPRADGPFRVSERINNNAYKIELPASTMYLALSTSSI